MRTDQSSDVCRIDLNADLGEQRGDDRALLGIVTSANIATGAHAGGGAVLSAVTRAAVAAGVAVGAHPSYRDRAGFGRTSLLAAMRDDADTRRHFVDDLAGQVAIVAAAAEAAGGHLRHVKAHGALYNEAVADALAARIVLDAVESASDLLGHPLAIVTQPGGELDALARAARGSRVVAEGFVDRAYTASGRLVPRSEPGAVHSEVDSMVAQALDLAHGHVRCADGSRRTIAVESLCVHGDTPGALAAARAVRTALERDGWLVTAPDAGRRGQGVRPAGPLTRKPADAAEDDRVGGM